MMVMMIWNWSSRMVPLGTFSWIFASFCTILSCLPHEVRGYCPHSCQCDDIVRTVACPHEAQLEVIPITLNPMIEALDLQGNQIRTVDASFQFYGQLKEVNFGFNLISALPDGCFSSQKRLQSLSLESNLVRNVTQDAFFGLRSLKFLSLRNNSLELIPNGTFLHLTQLAHLDLSWNRVQTIGSEAFDGLAVLEELNLEHNQIASLPEQMWTRLIPAIGNLHLSANPLAAIKFKKTPHDSRLASLHLRAANLSTQDLVELAKNLGRHLKALDVSNNSIDLTIGSSGLAALKSMTLLERLKLGGNFLPSIGREMWDGLDGLRLLGISHTESLHKIAAKAFVGNKNLEQIDLSGCVNLRAIAKDAFRPTSNHSSSIRVKMSQMHWNPPGAVPLTGLAHSGLASLDLSHNFIHCDCQLLWLVEFLQSLEGNASSVVCSTPLQWSHKSLLEVDQASPLKCEHVPANGLDPDQEATFPTYPNGTKANEQALSPTQHSGSSSPWDFQFLLITGCVLSATLTALGVLILVHCRPSRRGGAGCVGLWCPQRIHLFHWGVSSARRSDSHQVCLHQPTTPSNSVPPTLECICCDKGTTEGFNPPSCRNGAGEVPSIYTKTRPSGTKRYTFSSLHIPLPSTRSLTTGIPPFLSSKTNNFGSSTSGVYQASGDFEFFHGSTLSRLDPTRNYPMGPETGLDPLHPDSSSSSFNTSNTRSSRSDDFESHFNNHHPWSNFNN